MKDYACELCNYNTKIKQSLEAHLKSQKHIMNLEESKKCKCQYCDKVFNQKRYLDRHQKTCIVKSNQDESIKNENAVLVLTKNIEIELLKQQVDSQRILIEKLKEEKEELQKQYKIKKSILCKKYQEKYDKNEISTSNRIIFLENEVSKLHNIIENNGIITKASISALNYAVKNFNFAPVLERFNNFTSLKIYDSLSILETAIYMREKKKLYAYIGDIIISTYKKVKIHDQASYIIRNSIGDINMVQYTWQVDKNGTKTREIVINPIIAYLRKEVDIFLRNYNTNLSHGDDDQKMLDENEKLLELGKELRDNSLAQSIIKYISPSFYMTDKIINSI